MNSGRSNPVEQPFVPWLEIAKRKFVGAAIHNSGGQFAVAVMNRVDVYLFDDFFDAVDFMAGHPQYRFYDLAETELRPCRTVPDAHDPDELRADRRAARAREAQASR